MIGVVCQQRPAPDLSAYDGLLDGPAEPAGGRDRGLGRRPYVINVNAV